MPIDSKRLLCDTGSAHGLRVRRKAKPGCGGRHQVAILKLRHRQQNALRSRHVFHQMPIGYRGHQMDVELWQHVPADPHIAARAWRPDATA